MFDLYGEVTNYGEGLQNLGLCSALRAFEQGGIFIVPHLLWQGPRFFRSHPKDRPIKSPLTTYRIYFNPSSHRITDRYGGWHNLSDYSNQIELISRSTKSLKVHPWVPLWSLRWHLTFLHYNIDNYRSLRNLDLIWSPVSFAWSLEAIIRGWTFGWNCKT
jgi:hypothetical protein